MIHVVSSVDARTVFVYVQHLYVINKPEGGKTKTPVSVSEHGAEVWQQAATKLTAPHIWLRLTCSFLTIRVDIKFQPKSEHTLRRSIMKTPKTLC